MKSLSPILAIMLLGISLIPNVALSKETPQSQSIKCQQLKQQVASLKSKIKVDALDYVIRGSVGTQISSQKQNSKRKHEELNNKYKKQCGKR
jgi:hypothetical protein